jgi:hypothetical protein
MHLAARFQLLSMVVATLLCSGNLCLAQSSSAFTCLSYEPAVVKIAGTLERKTFPGPPNYESVAKGDQAETYWFVELHSSMCVAEDKAEPDLNAAQTGVTEIQLVLKPEVYKSYKGLLGGEVIVTGTLFGAITAHHHTPVLLTASSLEAAHH